ncbi:uncharacterized protein LOC131149236 isoform X2 [Malania oleifera]|uniref:uncharacterized protein LOC131149236 isoform X2 n=1 Tax=Malania oleifera TaxID=397392 RepID=UPI0025AE6CB8|nr:uncharacterized protein LOC131149236 isoform X2 [Malania oleifera]
MAKHARDDFDIDINQYLDGVLQGTGDGAFQGTNGLSNTCEDFLLDAETSDRVNSLDYSPYEESCLGNLGSRGHFPAFKRGECGAEASELSMGNIPWLESTCSQNLPLLDKKAIHELNENFRNKFDQESSVTEKQWLKYHSTFGLGNLGELDNGMSLLESGSTSAENEGKTFFSCSNEFSRRPSSLFTGVSSSNDLPIDLHMKRERLACCDSLKNSSSDVRKVEYGALDSGGKGVLTQKRLRKPTRRYIEESLEQKGRYKKCGRSYKCSGDKFLRVRFRKQHCPKGSGETPLVCQNESFTGGCIQVPFGPPVEKGSPKRHSSFLGHEHENCEDRILDEISDMENFCAESEDERSDDESITKINTKKDGRRRKHHRLWTLSEVMKLIEGVSQYGVGRWTEIKRLLFSSSAHRTSVDLKDKWRNLLRASCTKLQSKREVEQGRKHPSHHIPQPVLHRVRELAVIYPYPRERRSKVSCTAPVPSAAPSTANLVPLSAAVRV